ncbi:MAG: ribonuclease HII [Clostridia bacterium]
MLEFEQKYLNKGFELIGGIDEVGRGSLAGAVMSACVIMPMDDIIDGVNDSKKLSKKRRDELYDLIVEKAIAFYVSAVDEKIIDEINILQATKQSMIECVDKIAIKPEIVLVDAVKLNLPIASESIIKGDEKSYSIACASILAKVTRDRIMEKYDEIYPQYQFGKHKGYGTKIHIEAIKQYGACEIHRRTFIKKFI